MDDSLEHPGASPHPTPSTERTEEGDENSSGDEDCRLDWSKLSTDSGRPAIPKRGEKDFEPTKAGGSSLQVFHLDRARSAMLDVLRATPHTSSKSISYGVWYPTIARTHVTLARGIHFSSLGHSVPRPVSSGGDQSKIHKRLELLPEESLYLIERGALFCTKESHVLKSNIPGGEDVEGVPMSVQQAFAEMIGKEDLTLERYQVYAYLKRLGFSITRTTPPSPSYPSAQAFSKHNSTSSLMQTMFSWISATASRLRKLFSPGFNWWRPFRFGGWLYHDKNYPSIFRSLRFLSVGHAVPLKLTHPPSTKSCPYNIFYNVYKPATNFKKTAPGPPDFFLVVINARTTSIPSLQELTDLFGALPEAPPPLPRRRHPAARKPDSNTSKTRATPQPSNSLSTNGSLSLLHQLRLWFFPLTQPERKSVPNPFVALKAGKKSVVVAVVDAGSISFYRFGEGAFEDWPMA